MKTSQGVKVVFSPATAYTVQNILKEWELEHTPVNDYVLREFGDRSEGFKEFMRSTIADRLARVQAAIEQLEE